MQRSTRTFSMALGAAALALGFSGFAMAKGSAAASDAEPAKAEISYADLNLANPNDAKHLYTRIEHAAYNVCSVTFGSPVYAMQMQRKCARQAIEQAVQSVGSPNLTAVYMADAVKRSRLASSR